MKINFKSLIAILATLILSACGDGSSDSSSTTSSTSTVTLTGVVAAGSPLSNLVVTAYETNGTVCGSATTKADGTYEMPIDCTTPFLLETNTAQGLLVAPWLPAIGNTPYMNVTPLTTGLFFGSVASSGTQSAMLQALTTLDQATLSSYSTNIIADMGVMYPPSAYGVDWPSVNLITTPFTANHTGIDLVLDQTYVSLPTATSNAVTVTDTNTNQQFTINPPGTATPSLSGVESPTPLASSVVAPNTRVTYGDFNYQQTLTSASTSSAVILDAGNGATGSIVFGPTPQTTSTFTPTNGTYSWGSPIVSAVGFDANAADDRTPAVAMICQSVAGTGTGSNNQKSTDVLVPVNATQLNSAALLVGVAFTRYYEDCLQGGTSPATTTGNYLSFDGQGNVTVTVANGSSTQTATATAAQMTGALSNSPLVSFGGQAGSTIFSAYSYQTAYGLTRYVLVEHGNGGGASNYVSVWLQ